MRTASAWLGATGQGTLEHAGVPRKRIIQCATLEQGIWGCMGDRARQSSLREKIRVQSCLFAGTTPLSPPPAGAALAALNILRRDSARRHQLFQNADRLRTHLRQSGWEILETPGPIIRLPLMNPGATSDLKARLLAAGIYPPFLKYGSISQRDIFASLFPASIRWHNWTRWRPYWRILNRDAVRHLSWNDAVKGSF